MTIRRDKWPLSHPNMVKTTIFLIAMIVSQCAREKEKEKWQERFKLDK